MGFSLILGRLCITRANPTLPCVPGQVSSSPFLTASLHSPSFSTHATALSRPVSVLQARRESSGIITRPPCPLAPHWVQPMGDPSWRPEGGRRERGWGSYSPRPLSAGQWCGHGSFPLLKVAGWWWLSPVATALLITAPSPCHSRPRGGQLSVPECLIIPRCFYYPHFGPSFSSHHSPLVHVPPSLSCPDPG